MEEEQQAEWVEEAQQVAWGFQYPQQVVLRNIINESATIEEARERLADFDKEEKIRADAREFLREERRKKKKE